MQALVTVLSIMIQADVAVNQALLQQSVPQAIYLMLQQSVERISRVRMVGF